MSRLTRIAFVLASLFTLVNVAGGAMAAMASEGGHTALHVALSIVGAYLMWRAGAQREEPGELVPAPRADRGQLQGPADTTPLRVWRTGETERAGAEWQQRRQNAGGATAEH